MKRRMRTLFQSKRGMAWLLAVMLMTARGEAASDLRLVDAVKRGDLETARALLSRVDVNAAAPDGTTALHWASYRGDTDMVDRLIRAGARVKAANRYGITPLSLACSSGIGPAIERLLAAGADPNTAASGGETVLMTASKAGSVDGVKALLASGADVHAREEARGQTALMWAAAEGHAAVIAALIDAGADMTARARGPVYQNSVPAVARAGTGLVALEGGMQFFSRAGRMDAFTPLLFAVRAGRLEAVRTLLERGANINDTAPDGTSALVLAAVNAHWDVAGLLVDRGADADAAGQGWTALHQIARTRTPSVGQFPPPVPTGRLTSLDVAKKILDRGANVDARMTKRFSDFYRFRVSYIEATPLFVAAKGADPDMMRLLLEYGADPTLTNATQMTALHAAAGVDMMFLGEDSGTDEGALGAVKVALEAGLDVNATDQNGNTPLHGAVNRAGSAVAQLLIEQGAKLDARNKRGKIPIQLANEDAGTRPEILAYLKRVMTERGIPLQLEKSGSGSQAER